MALVTIFWDEGHYYVRRSEDDSWRDTYMALIPKEVPDELVERFETARKEYFAAAHAIMDEYGESSPNDSPELREKYEAERAAWRELSDEERDQIDEQMWADLLNEAEDENGTS